MAITAAMVKELREMTGAGMMDCKKALNETDGNMDAAVEYLRKNGQAKAEKKAGRIAAEGLCRVAVKDEKTAAVVEVNSETDFVAKNADFQEYVEAVAKQAVDSDAADLNAFLEEKWHLDESKTVKDALVDKVAVIGENLSIRRFEKVNAVDGCAVTYVHGGGSVGVMIGFDVADDAKAADPAFDEMGKNVAMQIAAMNPAYLDEASVPAEVIEHEQGILAAQMKEDPKMASKPEAVLAKIAAGKMGKYYKENCLVEQEFVRSDLFQGAVKGYIDDVAKKLGTEIKANGFIRMTRGEGIEKRQENFAEEIAKQING